MGRMRDALGKVPWKKVILPIVAGLVAIAIFYFGITMPSEAKDPVARRGVVSHEQVIATLGTDMNGLTKKQSDLEQALGDKASTADLAALQQEAKSRDDNLQAAINLRPIKTDVDNQVGAETAARTAADTGLDTRLGAVETALADPANPGAGITDRLGAAEALLAPPPQPTGPIGHFTLHPVH